MKVCRFVESQFLYLGTIRTGWMQRLLYGITFDSYRREHQEHRKTFDTSQLLYITLAGILALV